VNYLAVHEPLELAMSEWICIAAIEDIPANQVITVQVQDQALLIYCSGDAYYVYPNQCTHEEVPLSNGYLVKGAIVCRLHGAKFDLATGHCLRAPAAKNLQAYAAAVREGQLWVNLVPAAHAEKPPTLTITSYRAGHTLASAFGNKP